MTQESQAAPSGLEGVVVGKQALCEIDGDKGELRYRGYDIAELVEQSSFEECSWLLWKGDLPTSQELETFRQELREQRRLPGEAAFLVHGLATRADPMTALRTLVSALATNDPEGSGSADPELASQAGLRLMARLPTAMAAYERVRQGMAIVPPDPDLDSAANLLWMLRGERPSDAEARILDSCLVLHLEHGMSASTFAARCTASTLSDLYSALTTAIGTLKGPLHGGANTAVMNALLEIGEKSAIEAWVDAAFEARHKIPGFGHRVYRVEDPRAGHLRRLSRETGALCGDLGWYELSEALAESVQRRKPLALNIDFFSASTYYSLGIPQDLYTVLFALARLPGWVAHVLEQYRDNRLIRPEAIFIGPSRRSYLPMADRGNSS